MDKDDNTNSNKQAGMQNLLVETNKEQNSTNDSMAYLDDSEYAQLVQYEHYAAKTMYEIWMLENVTYWVEEKIIPQWWSPNAITVIGNLPLLITGIQAVYYGGTRFHDDEKLGKLEPLPNWVLLFGAFSIQWFSWFDMMDGQRARRLRAGSPIGRMVDEAGDLTIYSTFALLAGYVLKAPPGLLCLSYASINFVCYSQEMAFIITGEFDQHAGEFDIGPVEIELILTVLFGLAGIFGFQVVDKSLSSVLPEIVGQFVPEFVKMQHVLASVFLILIMLFLIESIIKSFKFNARLATRLTLSPLIPLTPAIIQSFLNTEVFSEHFVLFFLVHTISTNTQIYRLMLSNMTKTIPYNPFGLETIFGFIPLTAHLMAPADQSGYYERVASYISIVLLLILFYGHIYLLSKQWLQNEGGKRKWWTITTAMPPKILGQ